MRRKSSRERSFDPLPAVPIATVLTELGADSVPSGFGWVRMACPFHPDRTPSAAVNHDINGYRCHSCGRSGDSIKLLQDELGLSFVEALDKARELTGESRGSKPAKRTRRASDLLQARE